MKGLIVLIFPLILPAQDNYVFGPSIRVNDDSAGSCYHGTTRRSIACKGDTVHLAWTDDRNGSPLWDNSRIYFSKSIDAGNTWSPNMMVSLDLDTLFCRNQSIALDYFSNIYVAYGGFSQNDNDRDVYFTKSTDGGSSFTPSIMVNDSTVVKWQVLGSIAVDSGGQYVYVVWEDSRNGHDEDIYLARSTDGGMSFLPSVRVNDGVDSADQWYPVIACDNSGQYVYVAWMDFRDTLYGAGVYFCRSTDYSQTFGVNYRVNDTISTAGWPSIYYKSGIIYCAWRDSREDHYIYFNKSTDGGISFGDDVGVRDSTTGAGMYPSIAADDSGRIYVVWEDSRTFGSTGYDIYFSFSDDSGTTFKPDVRVNDLLGISNAWDRSPAVAVNHEAQVFVAWCSDRNGILNYDIYFATGNYVGIQEFYDSKPAITLMCYPNPFREKTTLKFQIPSTKYQINSKSQITLKIYNSIGQLVKVFSLPTAYSLVSTVISWNGDDRKGHQVPAGIYFVELVSDNKKYVKKVVKIE